MARVFTITEGLENMGAMKTGGQGSVYKARRQGAIITAVKILPTPVMSETAEDKHFMAFQNEVAKLRKVNEVPNPNVVKIMGAGITDSGNFPYIEMEFIEGPDLEELLKPPHDPLFTIKETIKVAEHLAHALAHCHRVDVKHGDIKSNNVKYNIHSGNYVLLDFGMAVMSDEQRRTSLRHAGAIEFMAPEQNEGKFLSGTDIYSYGVILFELLAGRVPFPLRDRGETARNAVMVAHMEAPLPDLAALRLQHMPPDWPEDKKRREAQLPEWLHRLVYKCLEKKPEARFINGIELQNYVVAHLASPVAERQVAAGALTRLQEENSRLQTENASLREQLQRYALRETPAPAKKKNSYSLLLLLALFALVGWLTYRYIKNDREPAERQSSVDTSAGKTSPRASIGQFKVKSSRAYFHNEPDAATRRSAYMVPSNDVVTGLDEKSDFIYTEFTNSRGQTSKGWIRKTDLVPLDQWLQQDKDRQQAERLKQEDINTQLADARARLNGNQYDEAVYIYSYLAQQGVPEAMYHYGNITLQGKSDQISCNEAFEWVEKAAGKNYVPAKRTLGFLYLFADNPEIIRMNDYDRCNYTRNVYKGSKLLMEAVAGGDSTARKLLERIDLMPWRDSTEP